MIARKSRTRSIDRSSFAQNIDPLIREELSRVTGSRARKSWPGPSEKKPAPEVPGAVKINHRVWHIDPSIYPRCHQICATVKTSTRIQISRGLIPSLNSPSRNRRSVESDFRSLSVTSESSTSCSLSVLRSATEILFSTNLILYYCLWVGRVDCDGQKEPSKNPSKTRSAVAYIASPEIILDLPVLRIDLGGTILVLGATVFARCCELS